MSFDPHAFPLNPPGHPPVAEYPPWIEGPISDVDSGPDQDIGHLEARATRDCIALPLALADELAQATWERIVGEGDEPVLLGAITTQPVAGLVTHGFAAAIFTPWLATKPDFTVSYRKGEPLGHRVLRNRAGGALLFPDRLSAARGLRAMRAAMLPLEGVEWRSV